VSMEENNFEKYIEAGRILTESKAEVLKILRPGVKILEIAEFIEKKIVEKGGSPAFPVNISIDDVAAHYTPITGDMREIKDGEIVKIDLGVQVDGFIADSAVTYCSEKNILVEAVEKSLEEVVKALKPGLEVREIADIIEGVTKEFGVGVIVNLTGHGLGQYEFHAEPTVPNVKNNNTYKLEEGDVIAVEPFTCPTNGYVKESGGICEIFRFVQEKPVRMPDTRKILEHIKNNFGPFPFAKRWLAKDFPAGKIAIALKQLEIAEVLERYPLLREVEGKKIAQAEHTVIIKEKPIVITKLSD